MSATDIVQTQETSLVQIIERAAANPAVDIEKMERLLQMYERVQAKNAEVAFADALSALQPDLPYITEKGAIMIGEVVRSTYARYEDIMQVLSPLLGQHGFSLTFDTAKPENGVTCYTGTLIHKSGHFRTATIYLPTDQSGSKNMVQALGSATSYAKRYLVQMLLNIVSRGQDDDGATATVEFITESQAADLQALIDEVGADKNAYLKWLSTKLKMSIDGLDKIPAKAFKDAVAGLESKRRATKKKPA